MRGLRVLGTLCGNHCLLHGAPFMRDLAAVSAAGAPLITRQAQVAAGRVLVVALFGGLGGLHALGDGVAIGLPVHLHAAGVEVTDETDQRGLVVAQLLRGWREQSDRGRGLGLTCGVKRGEEVRISSICESSLYSCCENSFMHL